MSQFQFTVTITQDAADYSRKCESSTEENDFCEPQEQLGYVVGNAVRQMLAAQNCGSNELFWMGLLGELAHTQYGGEWVCRLRDAVERWWKTCGTSDVPFRDAMLKATVPHSAADINERRGYGIKPHDPAATLLGE